MIPFVAWEIWITPAPTSIEPMGEDVNPQSRPFSSTSSPLDANPDFKDINPLDPPVPAFTTNGRKVVTASLKVMLPFVADNVRVPEPPIETEPPPLSETDPLAEISALIFSAPTWENVTFPVPLVEIVCDTVTAFDPPADTTTEPPLPAVEIPLTFPLPSRPFAVPIARFPPELSWFKYTPPVAEPPVTFAAAIGVDKSIRLMSVPTPLPAESRT